jgi:hypothetical protein
MIVAHVACIRGKGMWGALVGKPVEKRYLGRSRRKWDGSDYKHVVSDINKLCAVVNAVMNFWFRKTWRISWRGEKLLASQDSTPWSQFENTK